MFCLSKLYLYEIGICIYDFYSFNKMNERGDLVNPNCKIANTIQIIIAISDLHIIN